MFFIITNKHYVMGASQSIQKINFEDMQIAVKNPALAEHAAEMCKVIILPHDIFLIHQPLYALRVNQQCLCLFIFGECECLFNVIHNLLPSVLEMQEVNSSLHSMFRYSTKLMPFDFCIDVRRCGINRRNYG